MKVSLASCPDPESPLGLIGRTCTGNPPFDADELNISSKVPVPDVVPRSPVEARQRLEHFDLPGPEAILIAALLAKPVGKAGFLRIRARMLVTLSNRPTVMSRQETLQRPGIREPSAYSLTCHAWKANESLGPLVPPHGDGVLNPGARPGTKIERTPCDNRGFRTIASWERPSTRQFDALAVGPGVDDNAVVAPMRRVAALRGPTGSIAGSIPWCRRIGRNTRGVCPKLPAEASTRIREAIPTARPSTTPTPADAGAALAST